jgi:hypothetical protein
VAGDKAFSAERYMQTLRRIGTDKLRAFYSDAEIQQLERLGRIAAYIHQFPDAAPVQTSGNFGALMNIAGRIPGVPAVVAVGKAAQTVISNDRTVSKALAAEVPKVAPKMSAKDVEDLSKLLRLTAVGAGSASAESVK